MNSFIDKVTSLATKMSGPMAKFSNLKVIRAIINGLVGAVPVIIVGSFYEILYVLGSPLIGKPAHALLPFLSPLAGKFAWVNSLTLGFMGLYVAVTIAMNYAEELKVNIKSSAVISLATFMLFNLNGLDKAGGIDITAFSTSGLFVAIIVSLLSVYTYHWFIKHNITIKMPSSVPPAVGEAFSSVFPFAAAFTVAWIIRTILNFNMVKWLNTVLQPFINGTESPWFAMLIVFIAMLLWSVGLHGDNMLIALFTPFGLQWLADNANQLASGVSSDQLSHVLAGFGQTGLLRLTQWTSSVWPLILLMIISKNKGLKALGWTTLWPGIFTIVEPVVYGLPIALNAYLMIPFVLSATVSTGVGYALMATPWFGKFFAMIPWATPPFLLGPLGTGDWKTILIVILSFVIGLLFYLPFWAQYVKSLEEQAEEENINEA